MNDNEKKRLQELETIAEKYKTRNKNINQWQKNNCDRVTILLPKGKKQDLEKAAKSAGYKTITDYIRALIEKDAAARAGSAASDHAAGADIE